MMPLWLSPRWRVAETSPQLIPLLRAACRDDGDVRLVDVADNVIRWTIETGLGPLLLRAASRDPGAPTSALWPLLQGADLTARVLAAQQRDAMTEVLDACSGELPPPVLLKGISIGDEHYPQPHLRPMRDIDVLVEDETVAALERILGRLGYRRRSHRSPEFYDGHHHGCPFFHPDTGVWIEVHRALFTPRSRLGADRLFSPASVQTHLRPSQLCGRAVRRLSEEFQIIYIACHWAHRMRIAGGMVAMVDVARVVNRAASLQWEQIVEWTEGSVASRHVALLLTYLDRHQLAAVPPPVRDRLAQRHPGVGRITREVAHALLDRYVVGGREFGRFMSERNFHRVWRVLSTPPRRPTPRAAPGDGPRMADGAWSTWHRGSAIAGNGVAVVTREGARTEERETRVMEDDRMPTGNGSAGHCPKRRSDVRVRVVDGETIILDRQRNLIHQLNPTGTYVWDRCDGTHTVGEIAKGLAQGFDVNPAKAEGDVVAMLLQLEAVGLVVARER